MNWPRKPINYSSHQASSLNLLTSDSTPLVFALCPPKPRPCQNSNSSTSYSTTSAVPAPQLPLTTIRGLHPLSPAAKPRQDDCHHILTNLVACVCFNSPWSSPFYMVKKKDGGCCPCGDYLCLNTATIPDQYPLPYISDFTSRISGSTVFSKLDLYKGYYQVPMKEDDIQKTKLNTPFGTFEFLRLTFGLGNAGNTFQRMTDQILGDLPFFFFRSMTFWSLVLMKTPVYKISAKFFNYSASIVSTWASPSV